MTDRSTRSEVRNPVVGLPGFKMLTALPYDARQALKMLLRDIAKDAAARAQKSWTTHKAPMALYWKAVSVYAGHIARAIK